MPPVPVPRQQAFLFYWTLACAQFVFRLFCRKPKGLELIPKGPCIFAANHRSFLDGPVLVNELNRALLRPIHMVSIKEPFDNPVMGPLLRVSGCVPYDRRVPSDGLRVLSVLLGYLNEGEKVALFPEGHVGTGDSIRRCRMGMALLAMESGAPVVPVALSGTERIMPLGTPYPKPGPRASITIAPPIDPAPWREAYATSDTPGRARILQEFTSQVMRTVAALSGQDYAVTH